MHAKIRALASRLALPLVVMGVVTLGGCNEPDVIQHQPNRAELDDEDTEPTKLAFEPGTVETTSGIVRRVDPFQRMRGTRNGLRVLLETDEGPAYVYLGPDSYMGRNGVRITAGDRIEVTGSVRLAEGPPVIIATEVARGSVALHLRDEEGRPRWGGGPRL